MTTTIATPIILAATDDIWTQKLRNHLDDTNVAFYTATTGIETIEHFERYEPDVLTVNDHYDDMSGLTVLSKLKETAHFRDCRTYYFGDPGNIDDIVAALKLGANDCLCRKCDPVLLTLKIEAILRQLLDDRSRRLRRIEEIKRAVNV